MNPSKTDRILLAIAAFASLVGLLVGLANSGGVDVTLRGQMAADEATHLTALAVSSELEANTIASTDAVTVGGALRVVGTSILTGNVTVIGTINGSNVYGDGETFSVPIEGANGLLLASNLTGTAAAGVFRYATGYFTKTLDTNSISVTTGITGATLALSGAAQVTGALNVAGVVSATGGGWVQGNWIGTATNGVLRYQSAIITSTLDTNAISVTTGITGATLALSGAAQVTGALSANTLSATDNITTSKALTATTFGGFGAVYGAISETVDYTSTQSIILNTTSPKTYVLVTAGGPDAELDGTTSISDGTYAGQLLVIMNVDSTVGHTVIVKNSANTSIGKDRTLDSGDAMGLVWYNSAWYLLWITDSSA